MEHKKILNLLNESSDSKFAGTATFSMINQMRIIV